MSPKAKQTGEAGQIVCPACQSKITSDGKILQTRSEFLSDLIDGEKAFEKAESTIAELTEKLEEANAKIKTLEAENAQLKTAPKEVEKSGKTGRVGRLW